MKTCSNLKCQHKGKPQMESNFHKGNDRDNLTYWCKDCFKENHRKIYIPHPRAKKPIYCDCGENNPENFHKGQDYTCKICRRKIEKERNKRKYHDNLEYREELIKKQLERYHKNKLKGTK